MNFNKYQQRGMSGTTIMFLIVILIFILIVFFKLFPIYMENMTVVSALEKLKEEQNITQKMDSEIQRMFLGYLSDKDVKLFDSENVKQHVTIDRITEEEIVEITVEYQRVKSLMGNVSFLIEFKNSVEAPWVKIIEIYAMRWVTTLSKKIT